MATFLHVRVTTEPLQWQRVAHAIAEGFASQAKAGAGAAVGLYGIWRSQIGRPRDELTLVATGAEEGAATRAVAHILGTVPGVRRHSCLAMTPTLRPTDSVPPRRQGNYAFRWFRTPAANWEEFLALCAAGWPGFEAAYDSQVIGLWRVVGEPQQEGDEVRSLLLTRRPDLAMWERSKLPQGTAEADVRAKLSRRYDLCSATVVYTTTLITAEDRQDTARWT